MAGMRLSRVKLILPYSRSSRCRVRPTEKHVALALGIHREVFVLEIFGDAFGFLRFDLFGCFV